MLFNNIRKVNYVINVIKHEKRFYSELIQQERIRNIGVIAHIDAGKTTSTERMLFYSGKTRMLGEVHHGNTVTDFLSQERERGITICSAAVSFNWKGHKINLLDTPGHIDFTMEVEQSLGAVDGTVVILDASAGVEAQTVTVWNQSERYKLPSIVFVNKMDRLDANFPDCLLDMKNKLNVVPLPLQWPIKSDKGLLIGIIDILSLKRIIWNKEDNGRNYTVDKLKDEELQFAKNKFDEIIDTLSGLNDRLAEHIIESNSVENISIELILNAIRSETLNKTIVPAFLGSAYKNTGIQPLMDAFINFLPAPNERNHIYNCFGDDFVGRVFKITHDKQRGPLSFVRIFRGCLKKGSKISTSKGSSEQVQRMYEPLADDYKEMSTIGPGCIGICGGLKSTVTGDLLISSQTSLKNAQKKLLKSLKKAINNGDEDEEIFPSEFLLDPKVPDAVYFCSIEPPSASYQAALDVALKQIQREDPSLRIKYDETTLQTVLGGMGELHLDIIKSRLLTEYKIDADLGPLQIAYQETLETAKRGTWHAEKEIAGSKQFVTIELTLDRLAKKENEIFRLDNDPESAEKLKTIRPKYLSLVRKGAIAAIERGPRLGGQLTGVSIILHSLSVGRGTADSFLMAASTQCVQKILADSDCKLLEPIMHLEIIVPSDRVSQILSDLGKRRSTILDVKQRGDINKIITVNAPLAELGGYSSVLRTISSGGASMSMQTCGFCPLTPQEEFLAVRRAQGLE